MNYVFVCLLVSLSLSKYLSYDWLLLELISAQSASTSLLNQPLEQSMLVYPLDQSKRFEKLVVAVMVDKECSSYFPVISKLQLICQ